jgi:large conductance mechanosensitive channel
MIKKGSENMSNNQTNEMILQRLTEIKELLTPKPAPPPSPPVKKSFSEDFMDFLNKYGVVGLAIAFIIGGAAGTLISALVNDLIMPIISVLIPGGAWRTTVFYVGPIMFLLGDFAGALINFIIIALVVYMLSKQLSKTKLK